MPRLFVALEIPDDVRGELVALRRGIAGARWVPDEQFHLTLAFLGELDGPTAAAARDGLHGVRADPFELELSGVGRFPPRGRPRVLWAGLRDADDVTVLADAVRRCLGRRGVPTDSRRFAPHVTLARLRDATDHAVTAFLTEWASWRAEPFPVTEFLLYSSHLGRAGAEHRLEAAYPLIPGSAPPA